MSAPHQRRYTVRGEKTTGGLPFRFDHTMSLPPSVDPALAAAKALTTPRTPLETVDEVATTIRTHYQPLLQQVSTSFGYLAGIVSGEDGYPNGRRIHEALDTLAGLNALIAAGERKHPKHHNPL